MNRDTFEVFGREFHLDIESVDIATEAEIISSDKRMPFDEVISIIKKAQSEAHVNVKKKEQVMGGLPFLSPVPVTPNSKPLDLPPAMDPQAQDMDDRRMFSLPGGETTW